MFYCSESSVFASATAATFVLYLLQNSLAHMQYMYVTASMEIEDHGANRFGARLRRCSLFNVSNFADIVERGNGIWLILAARSLRGEFGAI